MYAVASIKTGHQEEEEFKQSFQSALESMQSHCHFSMQDTFGNYSKELPRTTREQDLVSTALEKAQSVTCWQKR